MSWQKTLEHLENNKKWEEGTTLIKNIDKSYSNNKEFYIHILYFFECIAFAEENIKKLKYYSSLAQYYFSISYQLFSNDAQYLFFVGNILSLAPSFFNIDTDTTQKMLIKAHYLEPNYLLYQWSPEQSVEFAQHILAKRALLKEQLEPMGVPGNALLKMIIHWSEVKVHEHKTANKNNELEK